MEVVLKNTGGERGLLWCLPSHPSVVCPSLTCVDMHAVAPVTPPTDPGPTCPIPTCLCSQLGACLSVCTPLHHAACVQVRLLVANVGLEVLSLKRTRIGGLRIPRDLPPGTYK